MSLGIVIATQVKERGGIERACRVLKLDQPVDGTHRLYDRSVAGCGVYLDGWEYPIVFDLATGEAVYDNYNGAWGDEARLREFICRYEIETFKMVAEAEMGSSIQIEERVHAEGRVEVVCSYSGSIADGGGGAPQIN